jgi:P pilus assembly chaperone PapD
LTFAAALTPLLVGCLSEPIARNGAAPVAAPVAAAQLEVTPSSISFAAAVVGVQNSQTLKLSNTGGTALTVTGIIATGAGLSINGFSGSTLLNPGTNATFGVQLTPKVSGDFSGSVAILSKSSALDTTLPVTGEVASAKLAISVGPSSLNFGTIGAGTSKAQSVTLTNTGNTEVTVSSISLSGKGFSMTGSSVPIKLASAQDATVEVQFSPAETGTSSGTLTVDSNASDPSVVVKLSGAETEENAEQHYVGLTWDASKSAGITGYNVYRGGAEKGPFSRLNALLIGGFNFKDDSVSGGATYYYVTTAVNSEGEESQYSNWAKAIVP